MERLVQIIIIVLIILIVIYLVNKPSFFEHFELDPASIEMPGIMPTETGYRPGHARRHPDQDVVFTSFNYPVENFETNIDNAYECTKKPDSAWCSALDPETITNLKQTILTDQSRTSKTQVAYNDVASYRPDRIRPFNEAHRRVSMAQADNGNYINDMFDNTFYQLWLSDNQRERDLVANRASDISQSNLMCVDYDKINQCMSVCSNTDHCTGFYIDKPGKCCMMVDPPFEANRHSYDKLPDNIDYFSFRDINSLIRRAEETDGKIVFDYVRTDGGNKTYKVDISREECQKLCPKCISGRCPENYRCTNMTADPRYNYTCMITNEDRYDEKSGHTFDSPDIPCLEDQYGLNEYAGYNDQNDQPVLSIPQTYRLRLDDRIVPSKEDLQRAFARFDANHVGPETYRNPTHAKRTAIADTPSFGRSKLKTSQYNRGAHYHGEFNNSVPTDHSEISTGAGGTSLAHPSIIYGPEGFNPSIQSTSQTKMKNIIDSNKIESFDPWVNRSDNFDPEVYSERQSFVAIRGKNDPVNFNGYQELPYWEYIPDSTIKANQIQSNLDTVCNQYLNYQKNNGC
jgi:hypothetical protein